MGSLIQPQDLNHSPKSTSVAGVVFSCDVLPRIEPKLEPLDEPLDFTPEVHPPRTPTLSYPPATFRNPRLNFDSNPSSIPELNPIPNFDAGEANNVYSEFNRISEMFNSAFARQSEQPQRGDTETVDPDSMAIVSVPDASQNELSAVVVSPRRRYAPRSSELVRVVDITNEDERYYRETVRKARMIFDSLRIFSIADDDRRQGLGLGFGRRTRGDLKAATLMKHSGLWLNRDKRIVGAIPGIEIGDVYFFRMELCVIGLHGQTQAGIDYLPSSRSSNGEPIATSIIVSGGYEDDLDSGDEIIYTGHGGQDKNARQCVHQKLEGGNLGLERSMHYGIEVRVIRGFRYEGSVSGKVYVYDGLYRVVQTWFDVGKSGFGVYKFKIVRIENQPEMGSAILKYAQNLRSRPLAVRPTGYASLDISRKKENVPVLLFNDIDNDYEPMDHQYLVKAVIPPYVYHLGNNSGCDCVTGCSGGCFCIMKNGGEFPYDNKGILIRGKPLIFECGPHCRCPPTCRNRVTQKGIRNRFEIFRSRETGWGVRSLDMIPAGAFICEYAGVFLTRDQAQVVAMVADNLVYPHRFAERWTEWGDLSQIYSNYVCPSQPSIPPLDFALDVSSLRNVACYMSHSYSPNVFVQFVLYDHNNVMFPRLMLFAMENIPPLRELSLDYGGADESTEKLAICD